MCYRVTTQPIITATVIISAEHHCSAGHQVLYLIRGSGRLTVRTDHGSGSQRRKRIGSLRRKDESMRSLKLLWGLACYLKPDFSRHKFRRMPIGDSACVSDLRRSRNGVSNPSGIPLAGHDSGRGRARIAAWHRRSSGIGPPGPVRGVVAYPNHAPQ